MVKRYKVVEGKVNQVITEINFDINDGLVVKPKNIISNGGIKVDQAIIMKKDFIEVVLKRKNDKKIELFLKYLLELLNDESSTEEDIIMALNELERFRRMIINKQRKYLEDKYIEKMLEKIKIIEEELKRKIVYLEPKEEKRKKGR